MTGGALWAIEWNRDGERLSAVEPTRGEIAAAAALLAADYNDVHNRRMMAHTDELSPGDVAAYYAELRGDGGRPFLLRLGDELMGDADLRNIDGPTAEFAIMVGPRRAQGRGLGTRYAVMVHAFAFRQLALERVYVSIIPDNAASLRLFGKLGYERDDSAAARENIDDDTDLTLSVSRARFETVNAATLAAITMAARAAAGA